LRAQIETNPDLHPAAGSGRNSPIAGVLLTNADLDHVLGLFLLREDGPIHIHASAATQSALDLNLGLSDTLNRMCGTIWHKPPIGRSGKLVSSDGGITTLSYRALELPGPPPRYVAKPSAGAHSVAYEIRDEKTGGRLVVAPDVAEVNRGLQQALANSDAVLFDGTFWSGDELSGLKPAAPNARDMGHLTIKDGSLPVLAQLKARHRIYIHINNTNPILALNSPERAQVEAAGVVVGYDGLEFKL
jgi:pyrroloquinoline quinone biosynthesis protein B